MSLSTIEDPVFRAEFETEVWDVSRLSVVYWSLIGAYFEQDPKNCSWCSYDSNTLSLVMTSTRDQGLNLTAACSMRWQSRDICRFETCSSGTAAVDQHKHTQYAYSSSRVHRLKHLLFVCRGAYALKELVKQQVCF